MKQSRGRGVYLSMNDVFARIRNRLSNSTVWCTAAALENERSGKLIRGPDTQAISVPSLPIRRRLRILCAGPDLKSVRRALKRSAYDVTVAVAGKQAWRSLMTGFFDLMVASLGLPGLDGIRLTERARLIGIKLPAILFSEVGDPFTAEERQRLGIRAVLERDCPAHILMAAVASAL